MRELQVTEQPQLIALASAQGGRAPLAHAVQSQNRRRFERTGKESAGRMTFMMIGENELRSPRRFEALSQGAPDVKLILQPNGHRQTEAGKTLRGKPEIGLQQTIKLHQRLVIK